MDNRNIAIDFEYILCPFPNRYLSEAKPYEVLRQWINRMYEHGYNIYIISEEFSNITSYESEMIVKWLHDNNINYNMLVKTMDTKEDYFYFIRRFESPDLFLCEWSSGIVRKFSGVDFNLPR